MEMIGLGESAAELAHHGTKLALCPSPDGELESGSGSKLTRETNDLTGLEGSWYWPGSCSLSRTCWSGSVASE